MALTLANYKTGMQDAMDLMVYDEFRMSSVLFDTLPFVAGATLGGADTWTYGYHRVTTQPTAAVRAVNTPYTAQEQITTKYTTECKIFGGSANIDRTQTNTAIWGDRLEEQLRGKIKATGALFNDLFINGDDSSSALEFDGIDVAVTGSSTERTPSAIINLSTAAAIASNAKTFAFELDEMLASLDGQPDMLLMNRSMKAKLTAIARELGYLDQVETAFGRRAVTYAGIPFVDLGDKPGTSNPIIATTADTSSFDTTSIFAVRFATDGIHAVSPTGQNPINTYNERNTVNYTVEAEMVATVAVKKTRAVGVLRGLGIAA